MKIGARRLPGAPEYFQILSVSHAIETSNMIGYAFSMAVTPRFIIATIEPGKLHA
jgi:hypothetical protein